MLPDHEISAELAPSGVEARPAGGHEWRVGTRPAPETARRILPSAAPPLPRPHLTPQSGRNCGTRPLPTGLPPCYPRAMTNPNPAFTYTPPDE